MKATRTKKRHKTQKSQSIVIDERLKAYRKKHHLTQAELSNRLFVSPQAISKWERGLGYPDIAFLPRLATLLECSVNDFFKDGSQS